MRTLLTRATQAINYFTGSNLPVFRSNGTISSFTGSTNTYTTTPGGETTAWKVESAANAAVTMDMNIKAVTRTGRVLLMVYSDFYGGTPTAAYNSPTLSIRWDNDGNFTDPWLVRSVALHPGWNCIVTGRQIVPYNTAVVGSPVWAEGHTSTATSGLASTWVTDTYTRFRTQIGSPGANLTTRTYYTQMVDDAVAESRLIMRFDDAKASVYTIAFPIMQARGLVGVLGVISGSIGTPGFMTWDQVRELRDAGWEIANHSKQHLSDNYAESEAYWIAELTDAQDKIELETGIRPTTYISPFGNFMRGTASGYRSAVELLFDVSLGTTDAPLGPMLLQGHYLPCHNVRTHTGGVTAAGHISRIKATVAAGCSSIMMFHEFTAGATTADVEITTADFTLMADEIFRIKEARFAPVGTVRDLVAELGIGWQLVA